MSARLTARGFLVAFQLMLLFSFAKAQQLIWKCEIGAPIVASPVGAEGMFFFGALDSMVYGVNEADGSVKWKLKTQGAVRSTPLIYEGKLFIYSGDGTLYCLNPKTGKKNWAFRTEGDRRYQLYEFADHFQSSPAASEGRIYFGSGDNYVYCVNAETGREIWKFKTGDIVHNSGVIANDRFLIGSFDGYFYALDKNTGKEIWKFKSVGQRYFPKGEFSGWPSVSGGTVYIGGRDFNLYALNIEKGYSHWNRFFNFGWSIGKPSFYKNMVIATTSDDRVLTALDTTSGLTRWKSPDIFNIFGGCSVADSIGYFGALNGNLYSINLNNGNLIWTFNTDGNKLNRSKYFTEKYQYSESAIKELMKDLGAQVPIFFQVGAIFSNPLVSGDRVIFTSGDGKLYCIRR